MHKRGRKKAYWVETTALRFFKDRWSLARVEIVALAKNMPQPNTDSMFTAAHRLKPHPHRLKPQSKSVPPVVRLEWGVE